MDKPEISSTSAHRQSEVGDTNRKSSSIDREFLSSLR
ncbi:unnamed protein product, partial [Rotaria sp. Silwood2]